MDERLLKSGIFRLRRCQLWVPMGSPGSSVWVEPDRMFILFLSNINFVRGHYKESYMCIGHLKIFL